MCCYPSDVRFFFFFFFFFLSNFIVLYNCIAFDFLFIFFYSLFQVSTVSFRIVFHWYSTFSFLGAVDCVSFGSHLIIFFMFFVALISDVELFSFSDHHLLSLLNPLKTAFTLLVFFIKVNSARV